MPTVSGQYDLNAGPALRELQRLREGADTTSGSFRSLGGSIDAVGDQNKRITALRANVRGLGTDATASERKLTKASLEKTAQLKEQQKQVGRLRDRYVELGSVKAEPSINLDGILRARAEIEALRRDLRSLGRETARPSVNVGRSGGGGGGGFGGGGGGGFNVMGLGIPQLVAAAGIALPAIQSLAGGITAFAASAAGALAGLGAAGIAGGGAFATGAAGVLSIGKPAFTSIKAAAQAQLQYQTAKRQATAPLAQMQQVDQLRSAENGLTQAQIAATQAQTALTQARRDARRELTDLKFAAEGAAISQERAANTLARARQHLLEVQADPTASALDLSDARLDVRDAGLQRRESKSTRGRSVADLKQAASRGVRNAPGVVAATNTLKQTQFAVSSAARALKETMIEVRAGGSAVDSARRAWERALSLAPKGTKHLIDSAKAFRSEFRKSTVSGQASLVSLAQAAVDTGAKMDKTLAASANQSSAAVSREGKNFLKFLSGPVSTQFIRTSTQMFDENLGNIEKSGENVSKVLMHVTEAARPFLKEITDGLVKMTGGWANNTRNVDQLRGRMQPFFNDTKLWFGLIRDGGKLLKDLFVSARPSGDSLVVSLDNTLNTWDDWLKRNPEKARAFFDRTVDSTKQIGSALLGAVGALNRMATALQPLLSGFERLLKLAGPISQALAPVTGVAAGAIGASPTSAAAAYLLLKGRGGGGAAGSAGGGSGGRGGFISNVVLGGGVAGLRSAGSRGLAAARVTRSLGGGLLGSARAGLGGARAAGALGAAGRIALPLAAISGGLAAAGTPGNVGERLQAALSSVSFGLIPGPQLGAQQRAAGTAAADRFASGLGPVTLGSVPAQLARLRAQQAQARGAKGIDNSLGGIVKDVLPFGFAFGKDDTKKNAQKAAEYTKLIASLLKTQTELLRARNASLRSQSVTTGSIDAQQFQTGFQNRSKRSGPVIAAQQTVHGILEQMSKLKPAGQRELANQSLAWLTAQKKLNPKIAGSVADLRKQIIDHFKGMGQDIDVVNGKILDGSQAQWKAISGGMTSLAREGVSQTGKAFTSLRSQALHALELMGYSGAAARSVLSGKSAGPTGGFRPSSHLSTSHASNTLSLPIPTGNARGGRLAGQGLHDTVAMGGGNMGAPGELVVNRHTEARVNRILAGHNTTLGTMVQYNQVPHSASMRFAAGGRIPGHAELRAGVSTVGEQVLKMFPDLSVTSTTGGQHAANSYHYLGEAVDIGGSPASMNRAADWVRTHLGQNLTEGIHNPNLSIAGGRNVPSSYWGPAVWAEHANHLHLAVSGALGALGGLTGGGTGAGALRVPSIGLGGALGALGNGGLLAGAQALQARLDQIVGGGRGSVAKAGARAGDSALSALTGRLSGGTSGANQALGRKMMLASGWAANEWPPLKALWTQESGWNANAVNPQSGAAGIAQSLGHGPVKLGDAAGQIGWGLCVPLRTRILTRRGWLEHDAVEVGDETIGFNPKTGLNEWTRIEAVHHMPGMVVRFGTDAFSAECTLNHRWVMERISGHYGPGRTGDGERHTAALIDRTYRDRIVLSRPADTESSLEITLEEAALLGWIAGDGSVGAPPYQEACHVGQVKERFFDSIDRACGPQYVDGKKRWHRSAPTGPFDCVHWRLSVPYSRDLMSRVGHPKDDAVEIVLRMSLEQRLAWLGAMVEAEGCGDPDGSLRGAQIYQAPGPIADAIILAVYLCGFRPGVYARPDRSDRHQATARELTIIVGNGRTGIPGGHTFMEEVGPQDTWCVTTSLGSWTAEQDGQVFLTGNSYIKGRYGSPAAAWAHEKSHNWYARGGRIPEYAGAFASGGAFTTRPGRPVMFQAGEGGHQEDVTIRRRRPFASSTGGHQINVNMNFGDITVGHEKDLKDLLEKAAEKTAEKIMKALDGPKSQTLYVA